MSDKLTPPFHVDGSGDILDANGNHAVVIPFEMEGSEYPKALCRIMNENANALVHAANGENKTKEE